MAKTIVDRNVLLLTVEGNEVTDVRLDYTLQCSDCDTNTSKSLSIEDCNQGQLTAIKNLMSALVRKAESVEGI